MGEERLAQQPSASDCVNKVEVSLLLVQKGNEAPLEFQLTIECENPDGVSAIPVLVNSATSFSLIISAPATSPGTSTALQAPPPCNPPSGSIAILPDPTASYLGYRTAHLDPLHISSDPFTGPTPRTSSTAAVMSARSTTAIFDVSRIGRDQPTPLHANTNRMRHAHNHHVERIDFAAAAAAAAASLLLLRGDTTPRLLLRRCGHQVVAADGEPPVDARDEPRADVAREHGGGELVACEQDLAGRG
ncbi:hypothetical protein Pelo_15657 [Pelomyxa schiedti]|nr:hypothetical protein Pelo_15657 [Pelomyxa schiedti]